jgi:integrase/recombinase XerD
LSQEEIDSIVDLDFQENKSLDMTRDIFLFSCYTGLRYNDAINLKMESISKINDQIYLRIDQGKTDERREIPILDTALKIIEKYTFCKERLVKNLVLPTLSNPKINQYLKYIANLAGITKPLSHHIARHTCATTILLDNDVPLETVSHWLGHNSVRTTQIYAKISHAKLDKESKRLNDIL